MATGTIPGGSNPSSQGSSHGRDWSSLNAGKPGSAFRGISRGKGSRGGSVRGGRGGPPSSQRGDTQPDTGNSTPSPSPQISPASRKPAVSISTTATSNGASVKAVNGTAERGGQPRLGSRKQPRAVPAVVVAPPSPSETSQTAPPTPSRSHRRRRAQPGKGAPSITKPLPPNATEAQKLRGGSTPASQTIVRKEVPPHLVAAHEAEIRHDIDALVERVRSIAMAENRPTTPGSHIDWAGDEDDSLPDLDDWGVTTTHTNTTRDEARSKDIDISPILVDTLKPLPEPNSDAPQEEEEESEACNAHFEKVEESPIKPSLLPSPTQGANASSGSDETPEHCTVVTADAEESSPSTLPDEKLPLQPSLSPKPVVAMESSHAKGNPISLPRKPSASVAEEVFTTKTEGLSESIHAPSTEERHTLESVSSTSSSERGLAASMHAPVPGLPESHSAPSLLSSYPTTATTAVPRTHSRSQTEGRPPPGSQPHRRGRSGASSPLGRHVYTHARNHSTPAGGASTRQPQASRPVITGEAISKLARTINGLGPAASRAQNTHVTNDSTVLS